MRGGRGGLEHYASAHEFGKVCVDDAVALLDGIVAREDVLGIVVAKRQVKGVKYCREMKITPLTWLFVFHHHSSCAAFCLVARDYCRLMQLTKENSFGRIAA